VSVALAAENRVDRDVAPEKLIDPKVKQRREIRVKVGADIPTPKEAARQFAGEKSNLASFQEIGVGYTLAKGRTPYWCVVFAKGTPEPAQKAVAKKKR
jgi:hypothetical protein